MKNLIRDEWGQDVVEYALLLGFLALASAGFFFGSGGNIQSIWGTANSQLAVATANSGDSSSSGSPTDNGHGDQGHGGDGGHHGGGGYPGGGGHGGGDPGGGGYPGEGGHGGHGHWH